MDPDNAIQEAIDYVRDVVPSTPFKDAGAAEGQPVLGHPEDARRGNHDVRPPLFHPFQPYIKGFTTSACTTANIFFADGSVFEVDSDVSSEATITGLDAVYPITGTSEWGWIETVFALDGTISSCTMNAGGVWADFPALYRDDGASGNTWYQPIFVTRTPKNGKSGVGVADRGEGGQISSGGSPPNFAIGIHILTNTHLVKSHECIDGTPLWCLIPGPGGASNDTDPCGENACPSDPADSTTLGNGTATSSASDYPDTTTEDCTKGFKEWVVGNISFNESTGVISMVKYLRTSDEHGKLVSITGAVDVTVTTAEGCP